MTNEDMQGFKSELLEEMELAVDFIKAMGEHIPSPLVEDIRAHNAKLKADLASFVEAYESLIESRKKVVAAISNANMAVAFNPQAPKIWECGPDCL